MRLKKLLGILLAMIIVMGISNVAIFAEEESSEGSFGNFSYYVNDDETITITSYYSEETTECVIPAEINGMKVTHIGVEAFWWEDGLTSIIIPEGVVSIGDNAFESCESLTKIVLPEGLRSVGKQAFYGCESLTEVTIPESLTSIGSGGFSDCDKIEKVNIKDVGSWVSIRMEDSYSNPLQYPADAKLYLNGSVLKEVNIPEGVTEICNRAFYGCSDIISVTIPEGVTSIGDYAFYGCSFTTVTLPKSLKEIESYAFYYCDELISISIPKGITRMAQSTFEGCEKLKSVILPEGLLEIGGSAFYGCKSLKDIKIPEGVTTIEGHAFRECESLTEIIIPDSVTTMGPSIFIECKWLEKVTLPKGLKSIGGRTFWSCHSLKTMEIPASVTEIGSTAFYDCISLTSVSIPNGVETIEIGTFEGCKKLTNIVIPKSVTTIERGAFGGCTNLTSIIVPANVKSVGMRAFMNCKSLDTVVFQNDVETFAEEVFSGCTNVTIYVPAHAKNLIKYFDLYGDNYKIGVSSTGKILASLLTIEFQNGKTEYPYTGKAIQPELKVSLGETVLTKDKDYTVSGLTGKKSVGRYKVTVTFKGDYEGTKDLYFTIVPKKSSSAKAELYGYDDVKFSWSKVTGASGYLVYYKKGSGKWSKAVATTKTYYKKANLSDGVKYTFKVVPYYRTKASTTKYYDANQYKTAYTYTLKKVTGVKAVKSGSKVKVSWSNISGETGYQISKMTKKSATQKTPTTVKSSSAKSKLLAATKGKTYYYKVRAYKTVNGKKIYGPWSTVKAYKRK